MTDAQPPLTWDASSNTPPSLSSSLPEPVASCLQNARFVRLSPTLTRSVLPPADPSQLHLATCTSLQPHVSLMNYTYLPSHPFDTQAPNTLPSGPFIVMTTNPSSRKTLNLVSNPNVSLLVHDWVSHRPVNQRATSPEGRRPGGSSLASLLMGMNTSAMGSISTTINGTAHLLAQGCDEEKWCKAQHLANNTFDNENAQGAARSLLGSFPSQDAAGDGAREGFIEDDEVRVVVVRIRDGRIADWKGGVKDWVLTRHDDRRERAGTPLVNGIS